MARGVWSGGTGYRLDRRTKKGKRYAGGGLSLSGISKLRKGKKVNSR